MITISEQIKSMLNAPARRIQARVELYNCSALQNDGYNRELLATYCNNGELIDFTIDRMGDDSKFFGFGICQKLTVHLRDKDRVININAGQVLEVSFGVEGDFTYPCPLFRVEEVSRDETTNNLTITAYDFLYKANEHKISDLNLPSYNLRTFVQACGKALNLPVKIEPTESFGTSYNNGANFDGTENLREALNAVAEATQTIYFVDWDWKLTFRRLDKNAEPVLHIDKSKYFSLSNQTDKKLTTISHVTELGDNIDATTGEVGATQFIRNNPFWDLREDIDTLIQQAINIAGGMVLSQFDLKWRGNFAVEIGDPITIATKNDDVLKAFLVNDTITYNGGMSAEMSWHYIEHNAETATKPVNINDAFKMTYAKVDKANKSIELAIKDMNEFQDGITETVTSLTLTTDGIASEVSRFETKINGDMTTLSSKVNQTAESINSTVSKITNIEGQIDELSSSIDQSAGSITSTVNKVETLEGKVNNMSSTVTQTANSLNSVVSRVSTVEGKTSTMESQIEQNADNINLKVDKNGIISAINLSNESIDISADKINLSGYATFNDLSTYGATTINGSNITTGTISADRINMSGAIDWADLSSSCKNTIASYAGADGSDADVPNYIKSTYIDSVEIRSPHITGNDIKVLNTFQTVGMNGSQEVVSGYMGAAKGMDAAGNTTFGVALSNEWSGNSYAVGSQYLIVTNAGLRLQSDDNRITITPQGAYITVDNGGIFFNHQPLADFVVEEGVRSSWYYRKWNSGTAECWRRNAVYATISTTWGSLFTSGPISSSNLSFPFTFAEVPNVQVTPWNNGEAIWVMAAGTWSPPSTTQTGTFEVVRAVKNTSQGSYGLNYYVVGKWK